MSKRRVHPARRKDIYAKLSDEQVDEVIAELTQVIAEEDRLARMHSQDSSAAYAWRSWAFEVRNERRRKRFELEWLARRSPEYFDSHQPPWYDPRNPQEAGQQIKEK